ncbi:pilus assembly protein PilM [bacterium]|nr:pilus assembly protein PilM [bacterium]
MFLDSLINPEKPTIALDIGSKFAKVVTLKKISNQINVIDFNSVEFPQSIEDYISSLGSGEKQSEEGGNEEFKDQIAQLIKGLIAKTSTSGKKVVTAINSRFLVTRIINVSGAPDSTEFNMALNKALEENFSNYQKNTIQISHEVLRVGDEEIPSTVLISAAKNEAIDFYKDILGKIGLKVTILDGVPFALYNIFEYLIEQDDVLKNLPQEEKNFLHIDIGYSNFNIIGIKAGLPIHFRGTFNFCDRSIIETIKKNEGLSEEEIYQNKYKKFEEVLNVKEDDESGNQFKMEVYNKYYKNYFAGQTADLIKDIEDAISQMDLSKDQIKKISFSGGGTFFPLLVEFVVSKFKKDNENLKVELLNPFFKMAARDAKQVQELGRKHILYCTATGLALRTL